MCTTGVLINVFIDQMIQYKILVQLFDNKDFKQTLLVAIDWPNFGPYLHKEIHQLCDVSEI